MSKEAILHAYRHVFRHGLRAIKFSKPARYTLRDRIRLAFRKTPVSEFDPKKIENTCEFLQYAAKECGVEHKIVKNLLFVWWIQEKGGRSRSSRKNQTSQDIEARITSYDTFNHNIRMLNESMEMCLPSATVRYPD